MADNQVITTNEYNFFEYDKFDIRNDIKLPDELIFAVPFVNDIVENIADQKYQLKTKVVDTGFYKSITIAEQNFIQCNNTYFKINTDDMKNILVNFQVMFSNLLDTYTAIVQIKDNVLLYNEKDKKLYLLNINSNILKSCDIDLGPNDIYNFSIEVDLVNLTVTKIYLNFEDITDNFKDISYDSISISIDNNDFKDYIVFFNSSVNNSMFYQAAISNISILESWKYNSVDDIKQLMQNLINFKVNKDVLWVSKMDPFEDGSEVLFMPFGFLDDNVHKDFNAEALDVSNQTYVFYDDKHIYDLLYINSGTFTFEYGKNITHFGYEKYLSNFKFNTNFNFDENTISFVAVFQNIDFDKIATSDINILQTDMFTIFYNNKALYGMYKTDKTTKKLLYTFENDLVIPEHLHIFIDIDKENKKLTFSVKSLTKESEAQTIELQTLDIDNIKTFQICQNTVKDYLIGISNLRIFKRLLNDAEKNLLFVKEQVFNPLDRDLFNKNDFLDFKINYLFDAKKRNTSQDINDNDIYVGTSINYIENEKVFFEPYRNYGIYINKNKIQELDEKPIYVLSCNIVDYYKSYNGSRYYTIVPVFVDNNIIMPMTDNIKWNQTKFSFKKFYILTQVMNYLYNNELVSWTGTRYFFYNITVKINKLNKKLTIYFNGVKLFETDQFNLINIESKYTSDTLSFWRGADRTSLTTDSRSRLHNDLILFNTGYFNENQIPIFAQITTINPKYLTNNYFAKYIQSIFDFDNLINSQTINEENNNLIIHKIDKPIIIFKNLPIVSYFQNNLTIKISFIKKPNVKLFNAKLYDNIIDENLIIYTDDEYLKIDLTNLPIRYQANDLVIKKATISVEKLENLKDQVDLYVYYLGGILYVYIDNILKFRANVNLYNINNFILGGLNIEQFSLPS